MSDQQKPRQIGFDGIDTVWLVRPVEAYGERIDKLVFREPSLKDAGACGVPFRFTTDGETVMDIHSIMKWTELLANVPKSTVESLHVRDALALQAAVMSFFGETESQATSSTAATTSRGDGG